MMFMIWCQPKNGLENGVWFGLSSPNGHREFDTFESAKRVAGLWNVYDRSMTYQVREYHEDKK